MVKFKQFLFRVIIKTNSRYDYIYIYFPIAFMYYKSTVCKKVIFYFKSSFEKHELHLLAARKIVCPPLRTNTNDTLILTSHTGYTCKFILIYIYINLPERRRSDSARTIYLYIIFGNLRDFTPFA